MKATVGLCLTTISTQQRIMEILFYGDSPSNCEIEHIPPDDRGERNSTDTILCILDFPEWEFTLKDLHLVVNYPEEMCEYISWALPWHFNFPIEEGPITIKCPIEVGEGEDASKLRISFVMRSYEGTNMKKACPSDASETTCYEEERDLCPSGPGQPKCCSGGENSEGDAWVPAEECFGGPGLVVTQVEDHDKFRD